MIAESQMPQFLREVIQEESDTFGEKVSIQVFNGIPDTAKIPIEKPRHWFRIPNVICVFVDMKDSTHLSATKHDQSTARVYRLFSGTAVRMFHELESPYIDVKGDGIFGLFNQINPYRALAAAVSFKTFVEEVFVQAVQENTGIKLGAHLGIDQRTVLVRKIGLKVHGGRTDRQSEVWAGRPINMAAKLASLSEPGELLVSDRFFENITDQHATHSCGCQPDGSHGEPTYLWDERDVSQDTRFDFEKAHRLKTKWCKKHGKEFCEAMLKLDES